MLAFRKLARLICSLRKKSLRGKRITNSLFQFQARFVRSVLEALGFIVRVRAGPLQSVELELNCLRAERPEVGPNLLKRFPFCGFW